MKKLRSYRHGGDKAFIICQKVTVDFPIDSRKPKANGFGELELVGTV